MRTLRTDSIAPFRRALFGCCCIPARHYLCLGVVHRQAYPPGNGDTVLPQRYSFWRLLGEMRGYVSCRKEHRAYFRLITHIAPHTTHLLPCISRTMHGKSHIVDNRTSALISHVVHHTKGMTRSTSRAVSHISQFRPHIKYNTQRIITPNTS